MPVIFTASELAKLLQTSRASLTSWLFQTQIAQLGPDKKFSLDENQLAALISLSLCRNRNVPAADAYEIAKEIYGRLQNGESNLHLMFVEDRLVIVKIFEGRETKRLIKVGILSICEVYDLEKMKKWILKSMSKGASPPAEENDFEKWRIKAA